MAKYEQSFLAKAARHLFATNETIRRAGQSERDVAKATAKAKAKGKGKKGGK